MEFFLDIVNESISCIILIVLALDSLRLIVAALGVVSQESKIGRLIYGKYDKVIVKTVLKNLGYSSENADDILIKMKEIPESFFMKNAGVRVEDADVHLIILLSKYILKFDDIILYGGAKLTRSNYYIDTMEISHNKDDRQKLAAIMICLLFDKYKEHNNKQAKIAPDVIITPKGGNPLFVQEISNNLNAHLIVAKSSDDKSRIKLADEAAYPLKEFLVNYEGSWFLTDSGEKNKRKRKKKKKHLKKSVIVDCNVSGGSQLLDIVKDIRNLNNMSNYSINIEDPTDTFVLFRADNKGDSIDKRFSAHGCNLHRFFDLDEEAKSRMYELRKSCEEHEIHPSYYSDADVKVAEGIIQYLKSKNLFYYRIDEEIEENEFFR